MSDLSNDGARKTTSLYAHDALTRKRNAAEKRFQIYGQIAVAIGVLALIGLLTSIGLNGASSFRQTFVTLPVYLDPAKLDKDGSGDIEKIAKVTTFGYKPLLKKALLAAIDEAGIDHADISDKNVAALLSAESPAMLRRHVLEHPDEIGQTVTFKLYASGRIDGYFKGRVTMESAALDNKISPEQLVLADALRDAGILTLRFNPSFFTNADASDTRPEAAGLGVAIIGSAYMMLIVLALALPIGVAASIYLEEFAPQNWFTDLIEVNISNLAAVPSIVFGILGLAVFINWAHLPQSAPVVGGLVLTLMTLPTIIIATRAAFKAVPPSIREAALGIGASKMQTIF
ncbi:MAG TPA: DUF3333 domain-containing protein, partial [Rhodobacterales bacterium]|nr:DUF3333 domain-containing protein [Rhodobacterales bacterium]